MAIIIEGIDNSGKSTLARYLADVTELPIIESEGPPRYAGEMVERIKRYRRYEWSIFVRHPCVSQPIYEKIRGDDPVIPQDMIDSFYAQRHLFIYCDPMSRGLTGHVVKDEHDTEQHLRAIEQRYDMLLSLYRAWAVERARVVYRIGDSMEWVLRSCRIAV